MKNKKKSKKDFPHKFLNPLKSPSTMKMVENITTNPDWTIIESEINCN